MGTAIAGRAHSLAEIDITDLAAVNEALKVANAIGHWRRILAIYGDHLPTCNARRAQQVELEPMGCDCGWSKAFGP